ncbi:hypothetical protein GRJ2_003026600 [Grus japonensis]|uniref:C2H2-type domain-containing protein n=1 Tax=Grus japonensis TaxID=30415 RepID=A0ABC9Y6E0_GRUJA
MGLKGMAISPHLRVDESEEEEESSPPGAMAQCSAPPLTPILGSNIDLPTEGTLVVKVLEENPSCPCCANWIGKMLGLTGHLKREHGKKKILFRCARCGRKNVKRHSITCHFPKCKGATESAQVEGWTCEECERVFETKISLGQHNCLAHSAIRNVEWILASHPKAGTTRAVHHQCWTEEEVELL